MNSTNWHDVYPTRVLPIQELKTENGRVFYARDIIIRSEYGPEHRHTLVSDNRDNLEIVLVRQIEEVAA